MKTLKRIEVTYKKVLFMPDYEDFEDNVIYISDRYGTAIHKCMCGCGEKVVTPLSDKMWRYQIDKSDRISMQPSVSNYQTPCKSHYIFQKGGANFV